MTGAPILTITLGGKKVQRGAIPEQVPQGLDWSGINHQRKSEAAAQRVLLMSSMAVVSVVLLAIAGALHLTRPDESVSLALVEDPVITAAPVQPIPTLTNFRPKARPVMQERPEPIEVVSRAPTPVETFPSQPDLDERYELSTPAQCVRDLQASARAATLYFDLSSVALNVDQLDLTRRIGDALSDCPQAALQLWGHADGSGDDVENYKLSGERAHNTLAAFSAMGFDTKRIEAVAFGATRPSAQGDADDAYDRRVEFRVIPRPN